MSKVKNIYIDNANYKFKKKMLWKLGTTTAPPTTTVPVSTTTEATTTTKVQSYEYKLKQILVSGFLYAFITQSWLINA